MVIRLFGVLGESLSYSIAARPFMGLDIKKHTAAGRLTVLR